MPIFEYVCNGCKEKFEKLTRKPDEPTHCPHCGGSDMTLQFSVFGFSVGQENRPRFVGSRSGGCGCSPSTCACGRA